MGLVTTFCPPMTIRGMELVCQATRGTRFVAHSSGVPVVVKPVLAAGQVKTTLAPAALMASGGGNAVIIISPLYGASGLRMGETSARIVIADESMIEPPPPPLPRVLGK